METHKIDIDALTRGEVRNLSGHDRGLAARSEFHLDELDQEGRSVEIRFPERFRGISSSFFQGMFAESVQLRGSVDGFFEHYRFDAPAHVLAQIEDYAHQALSRRLH
ncbi:MAG: hypothetical protein QOG72_49 [Sphingomonadales bacterium]|nr:hypothetical protein [Sphingomonadales bacterium]